MANSKIIRKKRIILGVTGASGAIFARRTLQMLEADPRVEKIHLVVSGSGLKLLRDELDLDISKSAQIPAALAGQATRKTEYLLDSDIGASIASGSYAVEGMVVIPCTTGCLAQIAVGNIRHAHRARGGRLSEAGPPADPGRARRAIQSHPSGKHAAGTACRRGDLSHHSDVLRSAQDAR